MSYFSNRTKRGFTLIEIVVVIAIIGLLSGIVMASTLKARMKARNVQRATDIGHLAISIELYKEMKGHYPKTRDSNFTGYGGWAPFGDPTCSYSNPCTGSPPYSNCGLSTENWIPDLVESGIVPSLPQNPPKSDTVLKQHKDEPTACYQYVSDGKRFILSAWASVEGKRGIPRGHDLFADVGFKQAACTGDPGACAGAAYTNYYHDISGCKIDQSGGGYSQNFDYVTGEGDYYSHSYTYTNMKSADKYHSLWDAGVPIPPELESAPQANGNGVCESFQYLHPEVTFP